MQQINTRLHHIDLLRGLIIIFMILDHAMVYCSDYFVTDPMTIPGTDPNIFFSRFISHFCAPLFIFLAGLSAALTERRYQDSKAFAKDLIVRGLVLILLEFTIISWSWSFNPSFPMLYAQVIWGIGWGFIIVGLMRLVGVRLILLSGLFIVLGHNLLDGIRFEESTWQHYVWSVLHQKNVLPLPFDFRIRTTYPVLPIIGLMAIGYSMGRHYVAKSYSSATEKHALWLGISFLVSYGLLRGFNIYGDSGLFTIQDSALLTVMSFLNPTKYPLSLQFMLLTVGTGLIALFSFKKLKPSFSQNFLQVLGKTSMFSYIAHLYLLHLISWLLIPVLGFKYSDMTYGQTLIGLPEGFGLTYDQTFIFTFVVVLLTALLARYYLKWKKNNKTNLIARYI
jgi:uncharacterized membrane protein